MITVTGKPVKIPRGLREKIFPIKLLAFDFDGVFTDNTVYTFQDGTEAVCCNRSDGQLLREVEKLGVELLIISSEINPVVAARAKKLKIPCIHSCENKQKALIALCKGKKMKLAQVAFVGNDINDLECLKVVGLPIVVRDAFPEVVEVAAHQTKACGGKGAVREICELFIRAKISIIIPDHECR